MRVAKKARETRRRLTRASRCGAALASAENTTTLRRVRERLHNTTCKNKKLYVTKKRFQGYENVRVASPADSPLSDSPPPPGSRFPPAPLPDEVAEEVHALQREHDVVLVHRQTHLSLSVLAAGADFQ